MATQAPSLQPQEQDTYKIVNVIRWILNQTTGTGSSGSGGGSGATPSDAINAGLLAYSSSTALTFKPMRGDLIKINGVIYAIPTGGIAGMTALFAGSSTFVNGTGSSNLSNTTLYYVYAFNNGGTITADFSTTAHATSSTTGNIGVEIKSGDDTRTLIGMIYTGTATVDNSATKRNVRSWFNTDREAVTTTLTGGDLGTTSSSLVEVSATLECGFVAWANEGIVATGTGAMYTSGASSAGQTSLGLDGTTPAGTSAIIPGVNTYFPINPTFFSMTTTEGHHFLTLLFAANASGGGTLHASGSAGFAPVGVSVMLVGVRD